jgi:excisionase family DNA binding protein
MQSKGSAGYHVADGASTTDRRSSGAGIRSGRQKHGQPEHLPMPLLTVDEVAEWLQIPKSTLYRQNSNGVPPGGLGVRVGRWLRYDRDVVQRWLEGGGLR